MVEGKSPMPAPAELAEQLSGSVEALARELVGTAPTSRAGSEIRFRSKGSLAVAVSGPKRGSWHDHEAGQGGDTLGLVAHLLGVPMREAYRWALDWLGGAAGYADRQERKATVRAPQAAAEPPRTMETARFVWRGAGPAAGSIVEAYLVSRGLALPDAPVLRFHPHCQRGRGAAAEHLPAMVALMSNPATGEACGVHRTFLRTDGSGKADGDAKMMLGNTGVIRLVPDAEVTLGLGLAEGIETALAVMQGFGWSPVWAATSAGAIKRFPVLPGIDCLTVFADADAAGQEAARTVAECWAAAGREVQILTAPRGDFNDLAREVAA